MTMNGLMQRYKESLKNTPKLVMPSQIQNGKNDLKWLMSYAKSKNVFSRVAFWTRKEVVYYRVLVSERVDANAR